MSTAFDKQHTRSNGIRRSKQRTNNSNIDGDEDATTMRPITTTKTATIGAGQRWLEEKEGNERQRRREWQNMGKCGRNSTTAPQSGGKGTGPSGNDGIVEREWNVYDDKRRTNGQMASSKQLKEHNWHWQQQRQHQRRNDCTTEAPLRPVANNSPSPSPYLLPSTTIRRPPFTGHSTIIPHCHCRCIKSSISIIGTCYSLLLLLTLLLPSTVVVVAFPGGSSSISMTENNNNRGGRNKMPKFTANERAQLRQAFLHKFGLDQLAAINEGNGGSVHRGNNAPNALTNGATNAQKMPVPDYMWLLYNETQRSNSRNNGKAAQMIRHYLPTATTVTANVDDAAAARNDAAAAEHRPAVVVGGQTWQLAFNLSATGRKPTKERVLRAQLWLPELDLLPDQRQQNGNGTANGDFAVFWQLPIAAKNNGGQLPDIAEWQSAKLSSNGEGHAWIDLLDDVALQQQLAMEEELHLTLHFPLMAQRPKGNDGGGKGDDKLRRRLSSAVALVVYATEVTEEEKEKEVTDSGKATSVPNRRMKRNVVAAESSWPNNDNSGRNNKTKANTTGERTSSSSASSAAAGHRRRQRNHHHHQASSSSSSVGRFRATGAGQCRRTELYVDFAELNWQDWIMAPAGYEAYQCRGRCMHPMPSQLNTTNHAIVQSLIHSIDPSAVAAPSCVPVQMSAISILYRDVNDVIVVKTYADMRVDACGCH